MKDIKDAKYLESIVSYNDMKAFVCQNRDDQHLFSNTVCTSYSGSFYFKALLLIVFAKYSTLSQESRTPKEGVVKNVLQKLYLVMQSVCSSITSFLNHSITRKHN